MKAIVTEGWGRSTRLVLGEKAPPTAGADDVLVEVRAASVNPKDWKLNSLLATLVTPFGTRLLPPLFGDDLAGVVVAMGRNVRGIHVGDAVYGMDMRLRTASLAEIVRIDQRRVARMPENIGFAEAATVPLAGQTALQALRMGGIRAGSRVLLIGASGGVGTFAVQIAKALGAHVTAVCSTRNVDFVRSLGADVVIDYTVGDYRRTAGRFDLVFDVTSYESPATCAALLEPDGRFITSAGSLTALFRTLRAGPRRAGAVKVESYREDLETIGRWIETGKVRVILDGTYSLAEAERAYERSRSGRARGKIAIEVVPSLRRSR